MSDEMEGECELAAHVVVDAENVPDKGRVVEAALTV